MRAVRGVSLTVRRGEVCGLVGESGSGKTTLGRCVLGLERPTSGRIVFEENEISEMSGRALRRLRPRIQGVFQDPKSSLNPRMTAAQIIEEPLRLLTDESRTGRRRRVVEMLTEVGLSEQVLGRYRHQLSGGQQQRISIARALVVNPAFVVLDEPVTALDASVRWQVLDLLRRLRASHDLTYLYISHDLDTVRSFCDRVAVMFGGALVEVGATESVFTSPRHPYTRLLLASTLDAIPGERRGLVPSALGLQESSQVRSPEYQEVLDCVAVGHYVAREGIAVPSVQGPTEEAAE